jgi:predicted TIM-barrel fold metal-dependent hydrolase
MPRERNSYIANLIAQQGRTATVTFVDEPETEPLFCPIISVDDHVLEPPNAFEGRLPARFADRAPRVETDDEGVPWWIVENKRLPIILTNGAAGRVQSEWKGAARCRYDEFRPGVYDSHKRLDDMDVIGVWASLCFPSVLWGFAGWRFARMKDSDLGLACLRAYNDWMIEDWCATDRDRFLPCQLPWLSDPVIAAEEIYRNAERGFHSVSFSENPEGLGFPGIYDRQWDPFFTACEETGTVLNLHVGSSGQTVNPSTESPPDAIAALFPITGIETVVDWIFSKIPVRHPGIKIALSEAGFSWVPMVIERLGRAYRMVEASDSWNASDPDPAQLLHDNFWFTSLEDPSGFRMLDIIGEDKVMVETDFPHMDSTWPRSQEMIRGEMAHLSRATIEKVCFRNAADLYQHPLPPEALVARSEIGQCPA